MSVAYCVEHGDVTAIRSDLLILKYAQNFYGADGTVAEILEQRGICSLLELQPAPGQVVTVPTHGVIAAANVMFIGVPSLHAFRYNEMRQFTRSAIDAA